MAAEDYAAAITSFERAISISPNLYEPLNFYSRTARLLGDAEKALEMARKAVAAQPDNYQSYSDIATHLLSLGIKEEAAVAVKKAERKARESIEADPSNSRAMSFLAIMLQEQGRTEEARQWIERSLTTAPDAGGTYYNAACFYSLAGEIELALEHVELAFEKGARHTRWYETDTDIDALRDQPRFKALMKRF